LGEFVPYKMGTWNENRNRKNKKRGKAKEERRRHDGNGWEKGHLKLLSHVSFNNVTIISFVYLLYPSTIEKRKKKKEKDKDKWYRWAPCNKEGSGKFRERKIV